MKGIDLYLFCMMCFLDPSHNICDNYSASCILVTTANMALPCTVLYKAKHLHVLFLSSLVALRALEMNIRHVKSCTQTESDCVCFIHSFA